MSITIGQVITSVRGLIPDLSPTLPAPYNLLLADSLGFGSLTHGIYFAVVTQINAYGESLPSSEATVNLAVGNSITVSAITFPGVTTIRLYITLPGGGSGNEIAYADFPVTTVGLQNFTLSVFPTAYAPIPSRSTAFLPDSDGQMFSANAVFGWLNDALNKLSHAVDGILDYCGVPTQSGQPLYTIPGQWLSISDVWYGGYWVQGGSRAYFYRRNAVTTDVLSNVTISITSDKQVMEVSYQPDRNSGLTSTTGVLFQGATAVAIADPGVFLLSFGFAKFSFPGMTDEIVAYASVGNGLMTGLIRGIGNTTDQQWPIGTLVTELSLFWCGRRVFNIAYSPGQSSIALPVPVGWKTILELYMLAQAKKAEQDMQAGEKLEKQAYEEAQRWMYGNRGVLSRVQVGGEPTTYVYDQTPAGGLIVP